MENNHLKYLINEEIYVIDEPELEQTVTKSEYKENTEDTAVVAEPIPETTEEAKPAESKVNIQGNASANVLILFNNTEATEIPEKEKTFLTNILKAVKLTTSDIGLINTTDSTVTLERIQGTSKANIILAFETPDNVGLAEIQNYAISEASSCKILMADSLSEIEKDTEKKKALWTNLQQLFLK